MAIASQVTSGQADQIQNQGYKNKDLQYFGVGEGTNQTNMIPDQVLEAALQEASVRANPESPAEIGSDVDMVDSYAPNPDVPGPTLTGSPIANAQQELSATRSTDELSGIDDGESDTYEPPEATPSATDAAVSVDSPPFSPAPPETLSEPHADHQSDNISTGSNGADVIPSPNHSEIALPPATQTGEVYKPLYVMSS
jgi:hypothetical protein